MRRLLLLLAIPCLVGWLPIEPAQQKGPWTMRQTGRVATVPGITSFACDSDSCDWTSYGAESCVGSQDVGSDFSTGSATSGTDAVTQAETTVYTLTCTSVAGTAVATSEVVVGGSPTLYDDEDYNVFATYDPLCDPANVGSTSGKNGVRYCEGFETTAGWVADATGGNPTSASRYYWILAGSPNSPWSGSDGHGGTDYNYISCNTGTHDSAWANFGAAGTNCTGTLGWVDNPQGSSGSNDYRWTSFSHPVMTVMGSAGTEDSAGTWHFSLRFYVKFAGTTSTKCFDADVSTPTGYGGPTTGNADDGTCPNPFALRGSNGYKAVVLRHDGDQGGLGYQELANWSGATTLIGGDNAHGFNLGIGDLNTQAGIDNSCAGGGGSGALDCAIGTDDAHALDAGALDWFEQYDDWQAFELVEHFVDGVGYIEIWQDNCGGLGTGCSSSSQTLWAAGYNLDLAWLGANPNGVKGWWANWYARGQTGEIQMDEIVFKDRSCSGCDSNIGWMDNVTP